MIDYNKLSYAEFLLISNAIIYCDIRMLQRDEDDKRKNYEIMIRESLKSPFLSNIMKKVNGNVNAIKHR